MPKKPPKDVTVTVKLHPPGSAEPFRFVQQELPTDGDNVLVFENGSKTYGFRVHFVLDDTENPGYRFPQPQTGGGHQHLDDALWVMPTDDLTACPRSPCKWDEFRPEKVLDDGKRLVVMNKNQTPQTFAYTLRVQKDGNYLALDPGGVNKNSGIPYATSLLSYAIAGGGAALVTAMIGGMNLIPDATIGTIVAAAVGAVVGLLVGSMLGDR